MSVGRRAWRETTEETRTQPRGSRNAANRRDPRAVGISDRARLDGFDGGRVLGMEQGGVSAVPGFERWSYGAFAEDHEQRLRTVPLHRDDGRSVEFTVPDFVADPEDLRGIAS